MMSGAKQRHLSFMEPVPLPKPAFPSLVDVGRLRAAQSDALREELKPTKERKTSIVLRHLFSAGRVGMTCRELVEVTGRGMNCWTQPLLTLRSNLLIETTAARRSGNTVYQLTEKGYDVAKALSKGE